MIGFSINNRLASIKGYYRRSVRRHNQHVDIGELLTFVGDVANRLLSISSGTSTYMNHQCDVGRSSINVASSERPFAMYNVHHKILIITLFNFSYLIFFYKLKSNSI